MPLHTYKERSLHISEHINHLCMGHHKTLLLTHSRLESGRPIKFDHHNSVRHCSGIRENSPARGVCLSAGLLWCLLTQEAYPEASPTPQQPSCKCPSPLEEYSFLPCWSDSVSNQQWQASSQGCLGTWRSASRESNGERDIHQVEMVEGGVI